MTANELQTAAANRLAKEISIVVAASDCMARGHSLCWDDYDRLHESHQFIIRVLSELTGREVTQ